MQDKSPAFPSVPMQPQNAKPTLAAPQYGFPTGFRQMAFGSSDIYGKTYHLASRSQFLIRRLQSSVITQYRSGSPVPSSPRPTSNSANTVPYVTNVSASVSSSTYGSAGLSRLQVNFSVPADQRNWKYARIYVKNFQGNPNYVMIGEAAQSPFFTSLAATGETIQIAVGSRSPFGEVNDYTKAPTAAVTLTTGGGTTGVPSVDGITSAVTLVAGSNITITDNSPSAGDISIAASSSIEPVSVRNYGAVGDGLTDDTTAFTNAAAANPQGILVDLAVCYIGTNLTLTCPIVFIGGQVKVGTGITLTLNGPVVAPATEIFNTAGAGTIKIGTGTSSVYAEWWGAVGDGTTDDSTAIQAAITSLYGAGSAGANDGHGYVQLLSKTYKVGTGLTVTHGGVGLLGVTFATNASSTAPDGFGTSITTGSASINILSIVGTSGSWIRNNAVKNLLLERSITPTGTAAGLTIQYSYGCTVDNVASYDSVRLFFITNAGSAGTGAIENSLGGWTSLSSSGSFYGFYIDTTGSAVVPSLRIRNSHVYKGGGGGTLYGLYATGTHIEDIHTNHFETAQMTYGVYLNSTGGAFYTNSDNIFLDNIHDGCVTSAYYITGMSSSNSSSVTILSGRVSTTGAGPGIDIESSNGVTVSNVTFASTATTTNHIKISGGSGNSINSNNFTMLFSGSTAVLLNSTSGNAVDSNIVIGTNATSTTAFKLTGASDNVLIGNAVSGMLATGISFDATSNNNLAYPNELAAATTAVSDSGSGNITTSVNKLDGISGPVTLVAGTGVTITDNSPSAGNITIASTSTSADYVVLSDGANPPNPVNDGAGNFIYVGYS